MFDVFIFVFVLLYLVVKTSLDAGVGDGPPQLPTYPDNKKCDFSIDLVKISLSNYVVYNLGL